MPHNVVVMVGTRPEVIKMAPVVRQIERRGDQLQAWVVTTAQHRQLLDQALTEMNLHPCADLDLMQPSQSLPEFASRAISAVTRLFDALKPDAVLVHGDTTTAFTAALAAFYDRRLIGHVEAGLRSYQRESPFPEEMNRRLIGSLAELHFAPTQRARENLLMEGITGDTIFVTGNTVVDALKQTPDASSFEDPRLEKLVDGKRVILVTTHRRETMGAPLQEVCRGLREIAGRFDDVRIVFPMHLNPEVRSTVVRELGTVQRIVLIDPVPYRDFLLLMRRCHFIVTDSGGMQEEASALGKPVLVVRDTTERPELLETGGGLLVGTEAPRLVEAASRLLSDRASYDRMANAPNPFGDGHAAERIVDILEQRLTGTVRPLERTRREAIAS